MLDYMNCISAAVERIVFVSEDKESALKLGFNRIPTVVFEMSNILQVMQIA